MDNIYLVLLVLLCVAGWVVAFLMFLVAARFRTEAIAALTGLNAAQKLNIELLTEKRDRLMAEEAEFVRRLAALDIPDIRPN